MSDTTDHAEQITPEEELSNLRQQLDQRDAEVEAERQRRVQAEQTARQATSAVAGAHEGSVQARIAAEEAALAHARAALKEAREIGDIDKEGDAVEAMATARQNLNGYKAEHSRILAERSAPQPQRQQQQDGDGYSPQARAWIARNPRFNSDPIFKGAAIGAHEQAVSSGMLEGSPAYFKHLDETLARTFGNQQQGGDDMSGTRQPPASTPPAKRPVPASSFATPPGRGNATTAARGADVGAIAGALGCTQDEIKMFAAAAGMDLPEYCKSQAAILDERRRSGGSGTSDYHQGVRSFK